MDSIEQAMRERASELEAITGGRVSVHCQLVKNRNDEWFRWFAGVTGGEMNEYATMKNSFNELAQRFQKVADERLAQKEAATIYDVIYAGG